MFCCSKEPPTNSKLVQHDFKYLFEKQMMSTELSKMQLIQSFEALTNFEKISIPVRLPLKHF